MDEAANRHYWNDKKSRDEAKLIFEGQGYVCENKHKNAKVKWKKLPIIVS